MRAAIAHQRARLLVVCVLGGYFALLAALGGYARWGRLGVPGGKDWWQDLRSVTGAWDCARRGVAVLPVNPCDPWHRPANYPRLWLLPYHLGLGAGDTMALGFVVAAIFLAAAILVVPPGAGLKLGALYSVVLCSPAAMLGVQRGNVDLTLFALVVLAVLVSRRGTAGLVVSAALLALAAALKLFPFFSTGFLLREHDRRRWAAALAVTLFFVAYVAALHHQIHQVYAAVPQGDTYSYGVQRTSEWISALMQAHVSDRLIAYRGWDLVLVLLFAGVAIWLGRTRLRGVQSSARDLDLFWAGACTYAGTFAVARHFDYRLVFLLMTVPQLAHWANAGSRFAWATIGALLLTTWLDEWTRPPLIGGALGWWDRLTAVGPDGFALPVVVLAQLALFAALIAWLAATARLPRLRASS